MEEMSRWPGRRILDNVNQGAQRRDADPGLLDEVGQGVEHDIDAAGRFEDSLSERSVLAAEYTVLGDTVGRGEITPLFRGLDGAEDLKEIAQSEKEETER